MLKHLRKAIFGNLLMSDRDREHMFLCESVDAVDLERRQRMLQRGEAPFQRMGGSFL